MITHLQRSIREPIRKDRSWTDTWCGPDRGLIRCWEVGREMAAARAKYPTDDLEGVEPAADRALRGELLPLPWKGGVHPDPPDDQSGKKKTKGKRKKQPVKKFGSLQYLAMWQGLRGENLDVPLDGEITLTCPATKGIVRFRHSPSAAARAWAAKWRARAEEEPALW